MADENKAVDEELKVTEQADGTVTVGDVTLSVEDARQGSTEDDHPDDEQAPAGETPEAAEERRAKNRERRAQNKQNRKDYIEGLKRELVARDEVINQLATRVDSIERNGHGSQLAMVDQELKKTTDAYNYFKTQIELGTKEQNGAVVADATEKMLQAQMRFQQLNHAKQAMTQRAQASATGQQPLDPRVKAQAEGWLERNPWFDIEAKDEDSFVAKQLDARLVAEGWNPGTEAYWQELDKRVKKYLPHKANSVHNNHTPTSPRSPVAGSGRDNGSAKSGTGYTLSAERVSALKDANLWDDPKARADAIKRYQQYDKEMTK